MGQPGYVYARLASELNFIPIQPAQPTHAARTVKYDGTARVATAPATA